MKVRLALAALAISVSPALAIDFGTVLKDRDGNAYLDCARADPVTQACRETTPMTLGRLIVGALDKSDAGVKWQDRTKVGKLQEKVMSGADVALDASEILMIEAALEKGDFRNYVVLQVAKLIDPASIK
jgi:hypothetical protein